MSGRGKSEKCVEEDTVWKTDGKMISLLSHRKMQKGV